MKVWALISMLYAKPAIFSFLIPNVILNFFIILNFFNGIKEGFDPKSGFIELILVLGSVLSIIVLWREELKMKNKQNS